MKTAGMLLGKILCGCLIAAAAAAFGQPAQPLRLANVTVTGIRNLPLPDVVAASGLRTGQQIEVSDLDMAVKRLSDTGYFKKVDYQYRYTGTDMDLEIRLVEEVDFYTCVFENFIWFSDEELDRAIRAKVPFYSGTLPNSGFALQQVIAVLEDLMRVRQIPGSVQAIPRADLATKRPVEFVFEVTGYPVPIHSLKFRSAGLVPETKLLEQCKSLLGQPYSKTFAADFLHLNLTPFFRQNGYLRVRLGQPEAVVDPKSQTIAHITQDITEGIQYRWQRAAWTGESPLTPEGMDRLFILQEGDIADGLKMDRGVVAVQEAIINQGYLDALLQAEPEYDDSAGTVRLNVRISAGPRYKMGTVTFKGVAERISARMQKKWGLAVGEPYDPAYAARFIKGVSAEITVSGARGVTTKHLRDRRNHTVNVEFEFN